MFLKNMLIGIDSNYEESENSSLFFSGKKVNESISNKTWYILSRCFKNDSLNKEIKEGNDQELI